MCTCVCMHLCFSMNIIIKFRKPKTSAVLCIVCYIVKLCVIGLTNNRTLGNSCENDFNATPACWCWLRGSLCVDCDSWQQHVHHFPFSPWSPSEPRREGLKHDEHFVRCEQYNAQCGIYLNCSSVCICMFVNVGIRAIHAATVHFSFSLPKYCGGICVWSDLFILSRNIIPIIQQYEYYIHVYFNIIITKTLPPAQCRLQRQV